VTVFLCLPLLWHSTHSSKCSRQIAVWACSFLDVGASVVVSGIHLDPWMDETKAVYFHSFLQRIDLVLPRLYMCVCVCEESLGASWGHQKHLRMWICSTKSKVTFPYITMAILILMGGISSWRAGSIFDPFMWPVHLVRPKHHSRLGLGEYQNLGNTWCRMFDSCFGTLKPLRSSDILLVYRILLKKWYILTECYVYWGVYVRIHM